MPNPFCMGSNNIKEASHCSGGIMRYTAIFLKNYKDDDLLLQGAKNLLKYPNNNQLQDWGSQTKRCRTPKFNGVLKSKVDEIPKIFGGFFQTKKNPALYVIVPEGVRTWKSAIYFVIVHREEENNSLTYKVRNVQKLRAAANKE